MYRYCVDNAVTYTPEDLVLFRESPFACWMERLTLENPDHGIPADQGSLPPRDSIEPQDDMADTLRAEGKDVRLIDWDGDEPARRSATLEAMRKGADFIVNGQLALGPLSGAANLLVRTSGYSELGDYLYLPCDTQAKTGVHSAFRLCFLADLLHSLQGQLPPQMLIIRSGDDLQPLQTDSHIYHYRAVKQRFMAAMRGFRKHRMPDPAESSHFGRWSDCAHEVLKQRMLREEHVVEEITDEDYATPLRQAVGATAAGADNYGREETGQTGSGRAYEGNISPGAAADAGTAVVVGLTLAEQARMLKPGTYKPGPGVYRLGPPRAARQIPGQPTAAPVAESAAAAPVDTPRYNRRASDRALQNLEFIRGSEPVFAAPDLPTAEPPQTNAASGAPAPSLRDPRSAIPGRGRAPAATPPNPAPAAALGGNNLWDLPGEEQTPEPSSDESGQAPVREPTQAEQRGVPESFRSAIDLDATHIASPPVGLNTAGWELPGEIDIAPEDVPHGFGRPAQEPRARSFTEDRFGERRSDKRDASERDGFSDSLITSDDYDA